MKSRAAARFGIARRSTRSHYQRAGTGAKVASRQRISSRFSNNLLRIRAIFTALVKFFVAILSKMKTKLLYTLQSTLGIAVSVLCAVAVSLAFSRSHWKLAAPFLFTAVLVLLAGRFGAMVSVVGSLLAAMIFSFYLFSPAHSFHVENEAERATLAWMILLSVSASYLLFPSRSGGNGA
jgi:K+-sensing histidine kinase KdpD